MPKLLLCHALVPDTYLTMVHVVAMAGPLVASTGPRPDLLSTLNRSSLCLAGADSGLRAAFFRGAVLRSGKFSA